jgi:serine/threonine protein phosphatase PrpC
MRLAAISSSVIGPAHQTENAPNQDAVAISRIQNGICAAVSDGLGSRPLSHIGSNYCVRTVSRIISKNNHDQRTPSELTEQVQLEWNHHFGKEASKYESTCLWASVGSHGYGQAAQVGDGMVMIKSQGHFQIMTPDREGFGSETQTIGRAKLIDHTSTRFQLSQPGDGVLLLTDGISDDLIPEYLEAFYDAVFLRLNRTNKRRCKKWLTKELREWSTPFHGDDKSIAGIFRTE